MRRSVATAPSLRRECAARYELGRELAEGGVGVIVEAHDKLAQRAVAYKRLRVRSEATRARLTALFQREFDTLARLPHPNIVEVYDYGVDEQGPYYTMELLAGKDLAQLAPLPHPEVCRILRDIASALALVHARRLVHRDISPNNIRLTSDGRAKLIDFGGLTAFGRPKELLGTPAFLAPECLHRSALDGRTDLYSLGALAYWMLTKQPVVAAQSLEDLTDAFREPPVAPSHFVPDLPEELDRLVLSLLSADPLCRPASAAYVIERLTAIADLAPERDERRVAHSYLKHPPLVGRDALLAEFDAWIPDPLTRRGKAVLIEGAAGLGRSALLEELALRAELCGATVLRGDAGRDGRPFSVARQLVNAGLALFPDVAHSLRSRDSMYFAKQAEKGARSAVEIAERHVRVLWSLQDCLLELSRRNPVLIMVDDAQDIDAESLSLLASLAHEVNHHALLLALAVAPKRVEEHAFTRLAHDCTRVTLAPLAKDELERMVDSMFGGVPNCRRLASWLHRQSGGNPARCMDLVRLLLQKNAIRYTLGTFTLPHDFELDSSADREQTELAQLADLGSDAMALAHVLSLRGGVFGLDELAAATELATHDVLRALEELMQRGVVSGSDDGFALASAPLATAIAGSLSAHAKQTAHLRLARAILARSERDVASELHAAVHLMNGGAEQEGADLVLRAIESEQSELEMAATWVAPLEAALAVHRKQGRSDEQCLKLLVLLVRAGYYGELAAQHRHLERTIAALSRVTGMTLASRLRRVLGGKLALLIGYLYAVARRALTPARWRGPKVKDALAEFVLTVRTAAAALSSALDAAGTFRVLRWLDPLASLSKQSGGWLAREASMALAELSVGNYATASARYAQILPLLAKPVPDLDDRAREAIRLSCLNGRAQSAASDGAPVTLELADQLERGSPFFAPHAECARMTYYAYRGEQPKAERHRIGAEVAALRGGTSWSATVVLTVRLAYGAALQRDIMGLVRVLPELERLSAIAPNLSMTKTLSEAWLEALRGRPERAIALYEGVIHSAEARQMSSHRLDRLLYATTCNMAGQHARAREICLSLLEGASANGKGRLRSPEPVLALAEAGLGDYHKAAELLEQHLRDALPSQNPLLLGGGHRDRAFVAVRANDRASFETHFAKMTEYFRATESAALMQQCDTLLSEAIRAGLRPARVFPPTLTSDQLERDETVIELYDGEHERDESVHHSGVRFTR